MPSLDLYQEVTSDEIYSMIRTAPNMHCTLDSAPTWIIKQLADVLAPVITNVVFYYFAFNCMFLLSAPGQWGGRRRYINCIIIIIIIIYNKRNHIPIPKTICTHPHFQYGCLSWFSPSRDSYRRLTPEPVFNFVFNPRDLYYRVCKKNNNNTAIQRIKKL